MSLTVEIEPEIEPRLRADALARGTFTEAARRLALSTLTDQEREALEDEINSAAAERARAQNCAHLSSRKNLDDLRRARAART